MISICSEFCVCSRQYFYIKHFCSSFLYNKIPLHCSISFLFLYVLCWIQAADMLTYARTHTHFGVDSFKIVFNLS